jgi:hypothetical protein
MIIGVHLLPPLWKQKERLPANWEALQIELIDLVFIVDVIAKGWLI